VTTMKSELEALTVLDDRDLDAMAREKAVHYLEHKASQTSIERLVQALEDESFGVRWAAAEALSKIGEAALPALLNALINKADHHWLREGAYHVLYCNSSPRVQEEATQLRQALVGPAADLTVPVEAFLLLGALQGARP